MATKGVWNADRKRPTEPELIDEIDFEETRRCLLTSYHSYIQIHSGYVITLIIGLATFIPTVIFTFGILLKSLVGTFTFGFLIAGIVIMFAFMIYMVLRVFYWTTFANIANAISIDNALYYFNKYNNKEYSKSKKQVYSNKAPNTVIIHQAIVGQIQNDFNLFTWFYQKFVLRNFRPRPPPTNSEVSREQ